MDFNDNTYVKFKVVEENSNLFIKDFFCDTGKFKYSLVDLSIDDFQKEFVRYSQKCNFEFESSILENNEMPALDLKPIFSRDKFFFKINEIANLDKLVSEYIKILKGSSEIDTDFANKNLEKIVDGVRFYTKVIKLSNDFIKKWRIILII